MEVVREKLGDHDEDREIDIFGVHLRRVTDVWEDPDKEWEVLGASARADKKGEILCKIRKRKTRPEKVGDH